MGAIEFSWGPPLLFLVLCAIWAGSRGYFDFPGGSGFGRVRCAGVKGSLSKLFISSKVKLLSGAGLSNSSVRLRVMGERVPWVSFG